MDHSMHAEDGCFVYQVIGDEPIEVRYKPSDCDVSRTGQLYMPGDMVAMDRILCSSTDDISNSSSISGGPYLRLADATGWLFERKELEQTMQRVAVQSGLWSFYIGNYPEGQVLLKHPTDRAEMCHYSRSSRDRKKKLTIYDPLQKVYCDCKVQNPQNGICFYRVQGTNGWLVEKRLGSSRKDAGEMLIEEHCVEAGLFAFQALTDVVIRALPRRGTESLTGRRIRRGDICVADFVYRPHSVNASNCGPFIHLTDGSGWVMENENKEQLLQQITVESGQWTVSVLNPPHGIMLYLQPVGHYCQESLEQDDQRQDAATEHQRETNNYWVTLTDDEVRISLPRQSHASRLNDMQCSDKNYVPGTNLDCDRKLTNGDINFYRVKDANGWIVDRASTGEKLVHVVNKQLSSSTKAASSDAGWTVEFVRGAAAVVGGIQELVCSEKHEAITFQTSKGVRLHVYFATRTVGITMDDPERGKTQLFCRDCSNEELGHIFVDPPLDAGSQRRYGRRRNNAQLVGHSADPAGDDSCTEEEGYRNELLDVEKEMDRLKEKEHELRQKVMQYDYQRSHDAILRRQQRKQRADELEKANKEISILVNQKVKEIAYRQEAERIQREMEAEKQEEKRALKQQLTCLECYRSFRSTKERDDHCRRKHGLVCDHCHKVFRSAGALDEHCVRRGHY